MGAGVCGVDGIAGVVDDKSEDLACDGSDDAGSGIIFELESSVADIKGAEAGTRGGDDGGCMGGDKDLWRSCEEVVLPMPLMRGVDGTGNSW